MNSSPEPVSFAKVEIAFHAIHLQFVATQERIDRLISLIMSEVLEAHSEFEAAQKAKQANDKLSDAGTQASD